MVNRVNQTLSQETVNKVNLAIQTLNEALDEIPVNVTPAELSIMPKMDVVNKGFAEKAVIVANNPAASAILPGIVNADMLKNDLILFEQLSDTEDRLMTTVTKLRMRKAVVGSEAFTGALIVKRSVDMAAKAGHPDAKQMSEDLSERFEGQGQRKTDDEDEPNNNPPANPNNPNNPTNTNNPNNNNSNHTNNPGTGA